MRKRATITGKKQSLPFVRYGITLAVFAILVIIIVLISLRPKNQSYTPPPPAVKLTVPFIGTLHESISINGYIEAKALIPVIPLVSGTITDYPARAGTLVQKGDLLAKIDDAPFVQQRLQAEAAYLGYNSSFIRVEGLYKAGSATRQEYDTLKAQRDAAKAQLDLANLQLGYTRVGAPVSGTILNAPLATGSVGSQQQPVAIIADLTQLVVRLNVPEKYFPLFLQNGAQLQAEIIRPGISGISEDSVCAAVVETVDPYIQSQAKTFQAEFALQGDTSAFRPGMFVKVRVIYRTHEQVPLLPLTVLKVDGSCYTYDNKTNTVRWVNFTPSAQDDRYFIVPTELKNTQFLLEGQGTVFDGQFVTPVTDTGTVSDSTPESK